MKRLVPLAFVLAALFALSACKTSFITDSDLSGEPTVYAKVKKAPNPLLFGHWRRATPPGINKPWIFQYVMMEKNGKVAVYYMYDSRKGNAYKGWAAFTVDGDSMVSDVDATSYYVRDGKVYMKVPGRDAEYVMDKAE